MQLKPPTSPAVVFAAALCVALGCVGSAVAQELKPRLLVAKPDYQTLLAAPASDRVTVKFRDELKVRLGPDGLQGLGRDENEELVAALRAAGVGASAIRRLHRRAEAALDAERAEGQAETGDELADLNNWYVVRLPVGANAAAVASRLNELPFVEYAAPAAEAPPPPAATPDFRGRQGYRKASEGGVGALYPARVGGADVRVVDVEYGWALDHEDLAIPETRILTGDETPANPFGSPHHGTAVLGIMVGAANGFGVRGVAPAATAYVAPAWTRQSGFSPARAISEAGEVLRRGDVLLLELQYWVCGYPTAQDRYGPIEWLPEVFDAVAALTARGVIVVAVAGNGAVDLDRPNCLRRFDRTRRDSRAILVGAGKPRSRARLAFSSYGSRIDLQGWGERVTTTGYGGLFNAGGARRTYTASFSGTSSAAPIVAGAVLAVQGVRRACGLKPLGPAAMRRLLVETGEPQGGGGAICPLPRILPAIRASDARACVAADAGPDEPDED